MVRELNMDTQRQNFWKEAIEKECSVRVAWMQENYNSGPLNPNSKTMDKDWKEKRLAARAKKVKGNIPKIPEKNISLPKLNDADKSKRLKTTRVSNKSEKKEKVIEMRPVSPPVRQLLYSGFTKEGKGRYQYLQARTAKKPEQKYLYPLTSSWEYGWHLDHVVREFHAPMYGRSRIVRDTFFRRNGILYEPITA